MLFYELLSTSASRRVSKVMASSRGTGSGQHAAIVVHAYGYGPYSRFGEAHAEVVCGAHVA